MKGSRQLLVDEAGIVDHVNGQADVVSEALATLDSVSIALAGVQPFAVRHLNSDALLMTAVEVRARAAQLSLASQALLGVAGVFQSSALLARSVVPVPKKRRPSKLQRS